MPSTIKFAVSAVALSVLAACSSTPVNTLKPTSSSTKTYSYADKKDKKEDPSAVALKVKRVDTGAEIEERQFKGLLAKRSVYFDYDSFDIKSEYTDVIAAHAKNLIANKNYQISIEGHTDERGGSEYNLALGQRRAQAVARMLRSMGVAESQIETVSFGKEKPKAFGHDEAAYKENRRADIVYPIKK